MTNSGCGCHNTCISIAVVAGLVIGVITAFLRFMAVITVTPAFLWVTLGIAIGYLAILLAGALTVQNAPNSRTIRAILFGILGTILFSIVLLAIPFAATSIVGALITGILLFFFSLTIASIACFVEQRL